MLQIGMTLNDRYEIIKTIGSGGMSVVYQARDIKLGRYVAIKVLREEFCLDESFVRKFKVEAQSAASLSHSNIVNIYDVGNEGRIHFIVMEYLEGVTLKEYIKTNGQLSDQEILKIAVCIASALEHAHNNHIIHRDIKPQNILLTNDGKVKVADFGIARVASDQTIDVPENASGSVYYIAPEQARGGYQDNKSDLYSLGITMYEMATGVLPFIGENAVAVALKQIHDPMPNPTLINPNLSKNVETIILKATQKKTTLRYQCAEEILDDIKLAMQNPEDVLIYTNDVTIDETMVMSNTDMKHIWNKQEVKEYGQAKDPLDKIVTMTGIVLALAVVVLLALFVYNNFAKKMIPEEFTVPDVVNLNLIEATTLLKVASFDINVIESRYDETVESGLIISQDPLANNIFLESVVVNVVVSKGIELIRVKSVTNRPYEEGVDAIEAIGLSTEVIPETSDSVPIGQIIRQDPLSNVEVTKNTVVKLYVSKGPEEVFVEIPELKDLSITEATAALERLNLVLGNVTYIYHDTIGYDKVISMTVEAGRQVKEGYLVDLAVSLGKEIKAITKSFIVNNVLNVDQVECELMVTFVVNGIVEEVYKEMVTVEDFPVSVSITSIDEGIVHIYNDGVQQYETLLEFTTSGGGQ